MNILSALSDEHFSSDGFSKNTHHKSGKTHSIVNMKITSGDSHPTYKVTTKVGHSRTNRNLHSTNPVQKLINVEKVDSVESPQD